jgi:serine/threonine protein kinase
VTDFGLCKENITGACSTSTVCGTPEYIAPEVILRAGHGLTVDFWSLGCIVFEMLTGFPPFYSIDRREIFRSIVQSRVNLAEINAGTTARDFVAQLLVKDPKYRLGAKGVEEVMAHPWFDDVDWNALENKLVKPPFVPKINGPLDVSWFSEEFTKEKGDSPLPSPSGISPGMNFKGFSYNGSQDSGCVFNEMLV